jgi:L-amino acid N-acyltransferase YncA
MSAIEIRKATFEDIRTITNLCTEHASFERASFDPAGHDARLTKAMQGSNARVMIFLAETETQPIGFASVSREFSTWQARDYLHMDCLYVIQDMRGRGVGKHLIEAVIAEARLQGLVEIQWQTPSWNVNALKFYRSLGAAEKAKMRFTMRPVQE